MASKPNAFSTLQLEVQRQNNVPVNRAPLPTSWRSINSPETSQETTETFDRDSVSPFRNWAGWKLWRTPPNVIISQVVSTPNPVSANSQTSAIQGVHSSPTTTSTSLAPMPDMGITLQTVGTVQINFHTQWQSTSTSAVNSFAVYRDGQRISTITNVTAAVANTPQALTIPVTDAPPNGTHTYAVYWSASTGTLTAPGTLRGLTGVNLRIVQ